MKNRLLQLTSLFFFATVSCFAQSAGDLLTREGKRYQLGENIISNPSFENGLTEWTGGDGKALSATYFTVNSSDGCDGGAYIVGTANKGDSDAGSLATGWAIEPNRLYYFRLYIKSLTSNPSTAYLVTTLTAGMTSDDGTAGRLFGNGSTSYTPAYGNFTITEEEWCKNEAVFNSADYTYLQCRFRWLSSQFGFDDFYLAPLSEVSDAEVIALLQNKLTLLQDEVQRVIEEELPELSGLALSLTETKEQSLDLNKSDDEAALTEGIARLQSALEQAIEGKRQYSTLQMLLVRMEEILSTTDYEGKEAFAEEIRKAKDMDTRTAVAVDYALAATALNEAFYHYCYTHDAPTVPLLAENGEYYLYNTYYRRLMGQNANNAPALSYLDTQKEHDSYVWVVESSETEGGYYLRQKSGNRYLVCSTANTWSMAFAQTKDTGKTYLWEINPSIDGTLKSLYSGKYAGCDAGAELQDYVGFYYDKSAGSLSTWQLLSAAYATAEEARTAFYKNHLAYSINAARQVTGQPENYKAESVQKIERLLEQAFLLYTDADAGERLDSMGKTVRHLNDALQVCYTESAAIWASGSSFYAGESYTVALNGLKWKEAQGKGATLVIQNRSGMGLLLSITPTEVKARGKVLQSFTEDGDGHNYWITCDRGEMAVYRDGALIGKTEAEQVSAGSEPMFAVIGESAFAAYMPEVVSAFRAMEPGGEVLNSHGKAERRIIKMVGQTLTLGRPVDLHLTAAKEQIPIQGCTLNLAHEDAWIIFEHTLPSAVIDSYLNQIKINGSGASNGTNLRVAIYLDGAALIPHGSRYEAFFGYDEPNLAGEVTAYKPGTYTNLSKAANTFRSFVLKRGYMVTLASSPDGGSQDGTSARTYSRVYVADHRDIVVNEIPEALNRRISFVSLRKWQYNSKKGWAATGSSASACKQVRTGWCYSWSAGYNSTGDYEYVPMKGHLWWPSWNEVNGKSNSNHVLNYNEPEHSEQHEAADCSCGGTISEWSAFTNSAEILSSGMRIGSPAPTDAGYLTNFTKYCDAYHRRCDFVCYHYYGTSLSTLKSTLASIHEKTGRPIWITEAEFGDSWGDSPGYTDYASAAVKIKEMMDLFESLDYVERYVIYNWDLWYNMLINYENWVTPGGRIYRDYPSTFAYNADAQFVSPWWRPEVQDVSLKGNVNDKTETIEFITVNPNEDITDRMVIQHRTEEGTWEDLYTETERYRYDSKQNSYTLSYTGLPAGEHRFRLSATTLYGSSKMSGEVTLDIPVTSGVKQLSGGSLQIIPIDGGIQLLSGNMKRITVYTVKGEKVADVDLKTGITRTLPLPAGRYIVNGCKIVINH